MFLNIIETNDTHIPFLCNPNSYPEKNILFKPIFLDHFIYK